MLFDYPLYLALRDMTRRPDLDAWIRDLRAWLEFERRCYPPRANMGLVRFLELHDTVSAAEYFGVGPSQALMALCTFIQGTPLIQQEQETGFSDDLAAWFRLRNRLPCFYAGEADYRAVGCSASGVIPFLRSSDRQAAVVAINLTGATVRARLTWAAGLARRLPVVSDALGGADLQKGRAPGVATVTIPPYRPIVLLLQRAGTRPTAPRAHPPRRVAPMPPPDAQGRVVVDRAARWFVETTEGRLDDAFTSQQARTRPGEPAEAVLPVLRRAWRPLASGLLDGSDTAAIGAVRDDGAELRRAFDPRRAADVRIENPPANGRKVTLVVLPAATAMSPPRPSDRRERVTAQFVETALGRDRLLFSRRHGGAPVAWLAPNGRNLLGPDADFYTDWGLVPNRVFASADGETNPRLALDSDGVSTTVTFRGLLRQRAWNGVQTCPTTSPSLAYRLAYRCERSTGDLTVTLGVTPSADLRRASAFLALRLPLPGPVARVRAGVSEPLSKRPGVRVGSGEPLELELPGGGIALGASSLQNAFVIGNPDGSASLFLCALDGKEIDLTAGREYAASVTLKRATRPTPRDEGKRPGAR
jgi:hypothetical protein